MIEAVIFDLAVAGGINVPPPRCAAIEDSANGLRSASAAGLAVIAIPHPRYPPDADALGLARVVLPSLTALSPGVISALEQGSSGSDIPLIWP